MRILSLFVATALVGVSLFAQSPRPRRMGPPPGMGGGLDGGLLNGPNVERRLGRALNLNAEQQNQLHTALEERNVQLKGMGDNTRDLRDQLGAAIRAGDEAKIDQVTRDLASANQQQQAITAKTLAKVYKSLDASQKATIERVLGPQLGVRPQRAPRGPNPPVTQ